MCACIWHKPNIFQYCIMLHAVVKHLDVENILTYVCISTFFCQILSFPGKTLKMHSLQPICHLCLQHGTAFEVTPQPSDRVVAWKFVLLDHSHCFNRCQFVSSQLNCAEFLSEQIHRLFVRRNVITNILEIVFLSKCR